MIDDSSADLRELLAAEAAVYEIDNIAKLRIVVVEIHRHIASAPKVVDLGGGHAEDNYILIADCVVNLNIRAVERAEGYRAVHHQLHVARAARLGSGEGYLLADIGGGHHIFSHGDVVVLHIDDLEPALDIGVVVDKIRKGADEADYLLRHEVAARRFCAEDIGVGREIARGIRLYREIFREDIERIEVLALILVQTLDLDIKYGVRVELDAGLCLDALCEVRFVRGLYLLYLREHGGVIFIFCELREVLGIIYELAADEVAEHRGQARVRLAEPAAVGDAVCDIAELVGREGIEIMEHAVLEYLAVESGDAVDAVAAGDAEVRHAHDSV